MSRGRRRVAHFLDRHYRHCRRFKNFVHYLCRVFDLPPPTIARQSFARHVRRTASVFSVTIPRRLQSCTYARKRRSIQRLRRFFFFFFYVDQTRHLKPICTVPTLSVLSFDHHTGYWSFKSDTVAELTTSSDFD